MAGEETSIGDGLDAAAAVGPVDAEAPVEAAAPSSWATPDSREDEETLRTLERIERRRRRRAGLIADDDAWLRALDAIIEGALHGAGAARGHGVEAAPRLVDGFLDAPRLRRVKFARDESCFVNAEAESVLRDHVAPALRAADDACAAHDLPFLATVRVFARARERLSLKKNLQADDLVFARAETIVDALVAAGCRAASVVAGVGGAAPTAAVEIDLEVRDAEGAAFEGVRDDALALCEEASLAPSLGSRVSFAPSLLSRGALDYLDDDDEE